MRTVNLLDVGESAQRGTVHLPQFLLSLLALDVSFSSLVILTGLGDQINLGEAEMEILDLTKKRAGNEELLWSGNEIHNQARQLNGQAGERVWMANEEMPWEQNIARGSSKQINGPVSDEAVKNFFA